MITATLVLRDSSQLIYVCEVLYEAFMIQSDREYFSGPLDYLVFLTSVLLAIAVMIAFGA